MHKIIPAIEANSLRIIYPEAAGRRRRAMALHAYASVAQGVALPLARVALPFAPFGSRAEDRR
jgi:hypothetical protein